MAKQDSFALARINTYIHTSSYTSSNLILSSGAEFIAAATAISPIVGIIDGVKQVYKAASKANGLPGVFREASYKLPLIRQTLEATKSGLESRKESRIDVETKRKIDHCQDSWQKLKGLFDKVVPDDGNKNSRLGRYYKAVRTLGKGGKVETLMKDILESIQLLTTFRVITAGGEEEVIEINIDKEELAESIAEVAGWESSVPDRVFEEGSLTMNVYGSGHNVSVAHAGGISNQTNWNDNARQIKVEAGGTYNEHSKPPNDTIQAIAIV
ncbi:hypothetical protein TWF481_001212 [Arthrobotrys musiformis]|uniref:NACHT-NTPase and P-loop NTPases N-terminal domain-containing protein n=1 Tax=Arthrobotrys musiformis TaxID=47236 RepID=A0AAV9WPX3_9PEZI